MTNRKPDENPEGLKRYERQILFPGVGEDGQRKLLRSRAVVIGCGALGSVIANNLARAGIGNLVIADRDFIELNNLQRQILFDEEDIAKGLPKATAAAGKLRKINSSIRIEPIVADVTWANIETLIAGADVVLDGTDNFDTRCLINDACVKHGIPWIYGGVMASYGMSATIVPRQTPCLRCLFPRAPLPGALQTCDTAGVLGSVVNTIASIESMEAMKLLIGRGRRNPGIITVDLWEDIFDTIPLSKREGDCPACGRGDYEYLAAREGVHTTSLCGHGAVQVSVRPSGKIDFPVLARRLESAGKVWFNEFLLRFSVDGYELTVFPDARTIIKGTTDEALAKTLYAKFIGA
ncbi:MAG: Molybdopterin-synthase adenylyltransferase [Syntrophaceae bacterium PtaU1.Bin231]|nr:MAG: Molybdopterin-synthase adenylyltransferase [Syntrophaceae bacterium PtaU1.Bin231]HOG18008.1 ThiF family adenylyltransferase [Syntrophales bacterium]